MPVLPQLSQRPERLGWDGRIGPEVVSGQVDMLPAQWREMAQQIEAHGFACTFEVLPDSPEIGRIPQHETVALLQVRQARFQTGSVVLRARRLVGVDVALVDSGDDQRITLEVDRLPVIGRRRQTRRAYSRRACAKNPRNAVAAHYAIPTRFVVQDPRSLVGFTSGWPNPVGKHLFDDTVSRQHLTVYLSPFYVLTPERV